MTSFQHEFRFTYQQWTCYSEDQTCQNWEFGVKIFALYETGERIRCWPTNITFIMHQDEASADGESDWRVTVRVTTTIPRQPGDDGAVEVSSTLTVNQMVEDRVGSSVALL
ncbi:MAG: hypothetical protein SGARI_004014 [Bacillariaceae sp.]